MSGSMVQMVSGRGGSSVVGPGVGGGGGNANMVQRAESIVVREVSSGDIVSAAIKVMHSSHQCLTRLEGRPTRVQAPGVGPMQAFQPTSGQNLQPTSECKTCESLCFPHQCGTIRCCWCCCSSLQTVAWDKPYSTAAECINEYSVTGENLCIQYSGSGVEPLVATCICCQCRTGGVGGPAPRDVCEHQQDVVTSGCFHR
jgi:hypothetical protein